MLETRHQASTSTWQLYQTTKPNWPLTLSLESIGPSRGASTASGSSSGGGGGRGVRLGRALPRRWRVPYLRRGRRVRHLDGHGLGALEPRREHLDDLDVPEHPVLRGGAARRG
jgi:hypothetical protein